MNTLEKPRPKGRGTSVPLALTEEGLQDKFYCDFTLDLSTLSDDELTLHDCMAQYSTSAINANIHLVERPGEMDERTESKLARMKHAKAIYSAYRSKINVERAMRKMDRPAGSTLEHYFMVSAKHILPESLFKEVMADARGHYPY